MTRLNATVCIKTVTVCLKANTDVWHTSLTQTPLHPFLVGDNTSILLIIMWTIMWTLIHYSNNFIGSLSNVMDITINMYCRNLAFITLPVETLYKSSNSIWVFLQRDLFITTMKHPIIDTGKWSSYRRNSQLSLCREIIIFICFYNKTMIWYFLSFCLLLL